MSSSRASAGASGVGSQSFVSRSSIGSGSRTKRSLPGFVRKKVLAGDKDAGSGVRFTQRRRRNRTFEVNEGCPTIENETEELSDTEFGLKEMNKAWVFDFLVKEYSLYERIKEENQNHKEVDSHGRKLRQIDVDFDTWKYVC